MKKLFQLSLIVIIFVTIHACSSTRKTTSLNLSLSADTTIEYGDIRYSGGNGSTKERAIKILNAKNSSDGISAEYYYIRKVEKKNGNSYTFVSQALIMDSLVYDKLTVRVRGKKKEYWFDITDFFGKF